MVLILSLKYQNRYILHNSLHYVRSLMNCLYFHIRLDYITTYLIR
nr:MAG TPA: hypothetical protein [Caudoviricetes sp.]